MAETWGSVLVPYGETRDVFVDNQKCGTTNLPFDIEIGTHDVDLGDPQDYAPPSRQVLAKHTPLKARQASLIELLKTF